MYSNTKLESLLKDYPFIIDFLNDNNLDINGFEAVSFNDFLEHFSEDDIENLAIDKAALSDSLDLYIKQMIDFLGLDNNIVKELTIVAGYNKSGQKENFDSLTVYPSQVISIVGPTGSGKSRLLADIEWAAKADTPTKRRILLNGKEIDAGYRFDSKKRLVAQLSQNMNFVMDLTVDEFLQMHAESRLIPNIDTIKEKILNEANKLAGEQFNKDSPITALSGGQSRALMIADTAILSSSPIVLIDEIENAGIDRKKAIELLLSEDKIVLIATHDPYLALSADIRIVINNGGVDRIIKTTDKEKQVLKELDKIDEIIMSAREKIRHGQTVESL